MLLTAFTETRKQPKPKLDLTGGQFFLTVRSFELSTSDGQLPTSLEHWPDAVCASAVRGIVQDICAAERSDWFFEAAALLITHTRHMCENHPWRVGMGPLSLHMFRGAQGPLGRDTVGSENSLSMELTPEPGDPRLSDNPDVAALEARAIWENKEEHPARPPAIPLFQQLTDAQIASAVRKLQEELDSTPQHFTSTSAAAMIVAGTAFVIELIMANLRSEESEVTFSSIKRMDGSASPVSLLAFRKK